MSPSTLWGDHARQWTRIGPPLRPSPADTAFAESAVGEWRAAVVRRDPTVLLLGVTPELCALKTGAGSRVIAVDRNPEMIRLVWPGPVRPRDSAVCGDWRRLPIGFQTADIVLADGCLSTLPFPAGYAQVSAEILRVLGPGGRWVTRCFVQPARPERVEDVLADLGGKPCGGFHGFKWRLAMALQPEAETGVVLARVWEALHEAEPDLASLSRRCGWPVDAVRTIEAYRGVDARYSFPSLDALQDLFRDTGFEVLDVGRPDYELGERCPSLVLARRDRR